MSADTPVSVIIPNLHSPAVGRTIASLRVQTSCEGQIEVLVVGQDKHRLVTEDELVRFVRTPGPVIQSVARNIGAREAEGDILVFIDADCVADQGWLQNLTSRFEDRGVDIVGGGVAFQPCGYWTLCDNIGILYEWLATSPRGTRPYLASLNLAVRRTAWEDLGGFDETLVRAEDTDWSIRARLAGYTLHFEPKAVIVHLPPESRNRFSEMIGRAFDSGYWTLKTLSRYREEIGLPLPYRQAWLMAFSAPLTAAGVTIRIFGSRKLNRFFYTLPTVYINKVAWRLGGTVQLLQQSRE